MAKTKNGTISLKDQVHNQEFLTFQIAKLMKLVNKLMGRNVNVQDREYQ